MHVALVYLYIALKYYRFGSMSQSLCQVYTIHLIIPITNVYEFNTSSTKVLQKLTNKMFSYPFHPSLELSESEVYIPKMAIFVSVDPR